MPERRGGSSPAPVALAALGSLRECVTAASNLRGLLSSLHVGPKVLSPLLPDIETCLSRWHGSIPTLSDFLRAELGLKSEALCHLEKAATAAPNALVGELRQAVSGPFGAKARLSVERRLDELLPSMSSIVAQFELLVDAAHLPAVAVNLGEVFAQPDDDSNRPHRAIVLVGPAEALEVIAAAQVVSGCLGCLASSFSTERTSVLELRLNTRGDRISFTLSPTDSTSPSAKLPLFGPSVSSKEVVEAALLPYQGLLLSGESGLTLPGRLVAES